MPVPVRNYLLTLKQLIVSDDARIAGGGQARTIIDGNASSAVFLIGAFSLRSGSWILLGRKLGYLRWLESSEKFSRPGISGAWSISAFVKRSS